MKLNKDDRIKYDDSIYAVVTVIWSTVYLRAIEDGTTNYDYEINEVYKNIQGHRIPGKEG